MTINIHTTGNGKEMFIIIPDDDMILYNETENIYSDSVYTEREEELNNWEEIPIEDMPESENEEIEYGEIDL